MSLEDEINNEMYSLREAAKDRANELTDDQREKEVLIDIMLRTNKLVSKDALEFQTAKDIRDYEKTKKQYWKQFKQGGNNE